MEQDETVTQPPHWLTILLLCLATYRLTRFIVADALPIVAVPRAWIQRRWDPFDEQTWATWYAADEQQRATLVSHLRERGVPRPNGLRRSLAYLVTCAWCVSIWVGAGVTVVAAWVPAHFITWWWVIPTWLAASAVTGFISQREPD